MFRILPVLATVAIAVSALAAPADAARVRVRQDHGSGTEGVKVDIPDLPPIDYKGLTNADALTVAISKTTLLPTATAGAKPLANLLRGTHLKKLGEAGAYFEVETADRRKGFVIKYAVARGKIALKPSTSGPIGTFTAAAATVVYQFPGKVAPAIGKLAAGQKADHVLSIGAFHKIKMAGGKIGYVEKAAGSTTAK